MGGSSLRTNAVYFLIVHALYSANSFYRLDPQRLYFNNPRWFAIVCGQLALTMILLITFEAYLPLYILYRFQWHILSLVLAIVHFYLMKIRPGPYSGALENNGPFVYVALFTPAAAILLMIAK